MEQHPEVLNSWKEIATYLGRGIRTVQRWEQELQLPIRRPRNKVRSAVVAFRGELDKWLANASADTLATAHDTNTAERLEQLELRLEQLQAEIQIVREKIRQARKCAPQIAAEKPIKTYKAAA